MDNEHMKRVRGYDIEAFGGAVEDYDLVRTIRKLFDNSDYKSVHKQNIIEAIKWLIEQAERAQELTSDNKWLENRIEVLTDVMNNADNADELNEEVIRLKRNEEYENV